MLVSPVLQRRVHSPPRTLLTASASTGSQSILLFILLCCSRHQPTGADGIFWVNARKIGLAATAEYAGQR